MKTTETAFIVKTVFFGLLLLNFQSSVKSQFYLPYSDNEVPEDHSLWLSLYDNLDSEGWRALNGIKECRIAIYKYKKNVVDDRAIDEVTYKFDKNGYVAESNFNKGNNKLISELNVENQIINSWMIEGKGDTVQLKSFAYDSLGRLIKIQYILKKGMYMNIRNIGSYRRYINCKEAIFNYSYTDKNLPSQLMVNLGSKLHSEDNYEFFRERYIYDEHNRILELRACLREATLSGGFSKTFSDAQCSYKVVNMYNINGQMIKSDYYYPDILPVAGSVINSKPQGYFMWKFTDDGKLLEYHKYDEVGKLQSKTVNSLDSNGNIVQKNNYDSEGKVLSKIIQSFNTNHQIVMKIEYNAENTLNYMYGYQYDERGTKIEIIEFDIATRKPSKVYKLKYL
jgi:hypothetical protein